MCSGCSQLSSRCSHSNWTYLFLCSWYCFISWNLTNCSISYLRFFKNCMWILLLLLLNISAIFCGILLAHGKNKPTYSIDLPAEFLSSPPFLPVSLPWLFFLTWRPSHSGFSSVHIVRKLACLKLTGEFRSGLPYLVTICLRKEITSAYPCRKMQTIFVKITVFSSYT